MALAITSFPVPVSPVISTLTSIGEICFTVLEWHASNQNGKSTLFRLSFLHLRPNDLLISEQPARYLAITRICSMEPVKAEGG